MKKLILTACVAVALCGNAAIAQDKPMSKSATTTATTKKSMPATHSKTTTTTTVHKKHMKQS